MDPNQIDSYQHSIKLYEQILLKAREDILQNPPPHLFPLPNLPNEIPNQNKMAVIIDPRYDELMEAVILNFMHFMVPEGWLFTIISAEQHKQSIQQRFPQAIFMKIDNNLLHYTQTSTDIQDQPQPQLSIQNYNAILYNPEFWNQIPCENITIFQKDCVMYRMFSEEWPIKYAYSGARCFETMDSSLLNGIINGGFSIRNKTAMLNCLKHITWETIELYRKNNFTCHQYFPIEKKNEDVFFTYACEILHYPLPQLPIHKQLAIESEFFLGASVFHGWTKTGYQLETWAREILSYSPFFSQYLSQIPPQPPKTPEPQNPEENIPLQIFELPDKSQPEISPPPQI